jgi:hypothetical protein
MAEIRFYGASDDLLEIEGAIDDEFGDATGRIEVMLTGPVYGAMIVRAEYTGDGVWMLGCSQADEDHRLPWPVRIVPGDTGTSHYSVVLVVDAPDGAELTVRQGER